jgi:hypothetical protein
MDSDFLAADGENLMGGSAGGKTMRRGLAGQTISVAGKPSHAREKSRYAVEYARGNLRSGGGVLAS